MSRAPMTFIVTLTYPAGPLGPPLYLARAPKFLRFVHRGEDWKTLDALDQLDDVPEPGETVLAAKVVERGTIHIDHTVKGKRRADWFRSATYSWLHPDPPREVLYDTEKWREWCLAASAKDQVVT